MSFAINCKDHLQLKSLFRQSICIFVRSWKKTDRQNTLVIARASQLIVRQAFRFSDQSNCASHSIALGTSLYLFVLFLFSLWTQVIFSLLGTLCVPESHPTCNVSRLTPEPINYKEMPTCQAAKHTATSTHTHSHSQLHTCTLGSLGSRRNPWHGKLAPNYFQHSKSSGTTAENLQSDFRNVVSTKDCWQILIAKDSRKINRTRQVDEMPNWTVERYMNLLYTFAVVDFFNDLCAWRNMVQLQNVIK